MQDETEDDGVTIPLTDQQASIWKWYSLGNKTQQEIATMLGIKQSQVSKQLYRVAKKMKNMKLIKHYDKRGCFKEIYTR